MLSNKVALITGAAQGIGLAATKLLLRNGARVSMVDLAEKVGKAACTELQKEFSPNDVMFVTTDVTRTEQLRSAFEQTKERFGGIDVVCNNAGIGNEKKWRKMIEVNLISVIDGTYLALEHMSKQHKGRGGTVVNVASFGGIAAMTYAPTYCASKHGVVGFSRSLKDLVSSDGVRVNCICPEFVATRMVTDGLMIGTQDVQSLVSNTGLLSPDAVAEGILKLITDESLVGVTMTVTLKRGIDYWVFPDEKTKKRTSSKL